MRNLKIRDIFPRGETDADQTKILFRSRIRAAFYARKRDFRFEKWPQTGTLTFSDLPRVRRQVTTLGRDLGRTIKIILSPVKGIG